MTLTLADDPDPTIGTTRTYSYVLDYLIARRPRHTPLREQIPDRFSIGALYILASWIMDHHIVNFT
jgi:hypothetical protein